MSSAEIPKPSVENDPSQGGEIKRMEFFASLQGKEFPPKEERRVVHTYFFTVGAHAYQKRDTGEPFFEHPRETALTLLNLPGIKNSNMISAALLHDTPEDTSAFGGLEEGMTHADWVNAAYDEIKHYFGREVAIMVLTLTKPKVDGIEIIDKKQAAEIYNRQLTEGIPFGLSMNIISKFRKPRWVTNLRSRTLLIKLADRFHNFRTIYTLDPDRIKRKIRETEEELIPICERVNSDYPQETEYLIAEIRKSIEIVRQARSIE